MLHLLFTVIGVEMTLILTLLFKTPLRKLVIQLLDQVKCGRGPVVVKTIAGTVFVVLLSSLYSLLEIQSQTVEGIGLNPTDQVLAARHMLDASLMGFLLFLLLMIDRLHHYIRELRLLRKMMEATKKQTQISSEDEKSRNVKELKALEEEITTLRSKVKKMEGESEAKGKNSETAKSEAEVLRKQSEGLLLEYDRLLEDNQNLRHQLESSDGKKNM